MVFGVMKKKNSDHKLQITKSNTRSKGSHPANCRWPLKTFPARVYVGICKHTYLTPWSALNSMRSAKQSRIIINGINHLITIFLHCYGLGNAHYK